MRGNKIIGSFQADTTPRAEHGQGFQFVLHRAPFGGSPIHPRGQFRRGFFARENLVQEGLQNFLLEKTLAAHQHHKGRDLGGMRLIQEFRGMHANQISSEP